MFLFSNDVTQKEPTGGAPHSPRGPWIQSEPKSVRPNAATGHVVWIWSCIARVLAALRVDRCGAWMFTEAGLLTKDSSKTLHIAFDQDGKVVKVERNANR